jgi:Domain of unknown function (DUF4265)
VTEPAHKVAFELEQDEHGYPPVTSENLWAAQLGPEMYRLDNIPFYAHGVASEDVVRTELQHGSNIFMEVVQASANSVFRIYVNDKSDVPAARAAFKDLGCESELSDISNLFAFEIPGAIDFAPVANLLVDGLDSDRWEYEEACLRHKATDRYLQRTKASKEIQEDK